MKYPGLLWVLVLPFVMGSCLFSKDKDKIVKVNPEFAIKMFEQLGETRDFQLHITTISNQPCTNYTIDIGTIRTANSFTLSLNDLIQPSFCLDGHGPALAEAKLGLFPTGKVKVNILIKNTLNNEGELLVSDDEYKLSLKTKDGLEIPFPILRRIPASTIWGYVGYDDQNAVGILPASFLTDISKISQDSGLKQGYYGYFSVDNSSKLVFNTPPPYQNYQTFKFWYEGSLSTLQKLVEEYSKAPGGDKMKIKIYAWDGSTL